MYVTTLKNGESVVLTHENDERSVFHFDPDGEMQVVGRWTACNDGWMRWYIDDKCVAAVVVDREGQTRASVRVDAADEVEITKKGF